MFKTSNYYVLFLGFLFFLLKKNNYLFISILTVWPQDKFQF